MEERTKDNCIWRDMFNKYAGGCRRLVTSENCGPNCAWHQTVEDAKASHEKARQNFIKNHGYDGYETETKRPGTKPRHYLTTLAIIALAMFMPAVVKAESTIDRDPSTDVIFFELVPEPTPAPIPMPVNIRSYQHNSLDVETLARLLWSSPLRDENHKRTLLWVVLNRVDDQSGLFGNDIASVVTKHEFSFYDKRAHLSETNMRIACDVLDEWKSERDGLYVGNHCPKNGVYIRFIGIDNRGIEVTAERGGDALIW